MRVARFLFFFLFPSQNSFHHIARLGDVRKVDLRGDCLAGARLSAACVTGMAFAKMTANLLGLISFERARVRLPGPQAHLVQNIENLTALPFQFSRQIVDSNLTHPPLFNVLPNRP
jgi:hypothetical protein